MANGLDLKERTPGRNIPENDPLMELSRIMGFDKPEPAESRLDPQIAAEDSFSMDLERELAFEEIPAEGDSFDAEFAAAFEDDFSSTLRFEPDAPSVVPSLEDELTALLDDGPAAEVAGDEMHAAPETDLVDDGYLYKDEPFAAVSHEAPKSFDAASELPADWHRAADDMVESPAFPWPEVAKDDALESELVREFDAAQPAAAEPEFAVEADEAEVFVQQYEEPAPSDAGFETAGNEAELHYASDPLDLDRDQVSAYEDFGLPEPVAIAADEPVTGDSDYAREDGFDAFTELATLDIPPAPEFDDRPAYTAETISEPELSDNEFQGFATVEEAEAPLVEATEPRQDEVLHTDDFEIPDFEFQSLNDAPPQHDSYDEFADELELAAPVQPAETAASASKFDDADFDFDTLINEELAAGAGVAAAGVAAMSMRNKPVMHVDADQDADPFQRTPIADDVFAPVAMAPARRNPWLVPVALAGVLALLGGGLYYAFSGNGASVDGNGPVLVKADPEPVKVAPENPGGATVANQDKAVYDKVEGEQASLPAQGALVSESEEPVDIAAVTPPAEVQPVAQTETAAAPDVAAKAEDRVETPAVPDAQAPAAETAAVTPKKVRTVIVKPDGTLVERPVEAAAEPVAESPAPESGPVASIAPAETPAPEPKPEEAVAAKVEPAAPAEDPIAQIAAAEPEAAKAAETVPVEPAPAEPAIKVVKAKKIKPPVAEKVAAPAETVPVPSDAVPVVERPADQPVNIVGQTGGQQPAAETQVASADPAPAAGGYSIQIASTPSPEAAKSTYAALNRKFGGIIGGKGVNIQKASVEGKGTVYRVRIPAGSKQNAAALCSDYKAAGGSCFVTK